MSFDPVIRKSLFFFFFSGGDKPNLSYTKGKGAALRRLGDKSEGTEPPPDQKESLKSFVHVH